MPVWGFFCGNDGWLMLVTTNISQRKPFINYIQKVCKTEFDFFLDIKLDSQETMNF